MKYFRAHSIAVFFVIVLFNADSAQSASTKKEIKDLKARVESAEELGQARICDAQYNKANEFAKDPNLACGESVGAVDMVKPRTYKECEITCLNAYTSCKKRLDRKDEYYENYKILCTRVEERIEKCVGWYNKCSEKQRNNGKTEST